MINVIKLHNKMAKFYLTKARLDSAKQYRKDFQNTKYHGFRHLYWIKSIRVQLDNDDEESNLVYINYKFGIKCIYEMLTLQVKFLLKDCGFNEHEINNFQV